MVKIEDPADVDNDGDLKVVDSFNLYWTADDEEERNRTYYFNDEVISEEQFNACYAEIFES